MKTQKTEFKKSIKLLEGKLYKANLIGDKKIIRKIKSDIDFYNNCITHMM
tara:strand:+ start:301 stop:450 length:150 start_codon:yes stop_codon:yes gene_type:complete